MPKHPRRLFGFTLLELLVVISIIGILVAMGAASFSVVQKQGRDARRRGDMKAVQSAMEQCRAISAAQSYASCCTFSSGTITCANPAVSVSNPGGGTSYAYTNPVAVAADNYRFCAPLEQSTPSPFCINPLQ